MAETLRKIQENIQRVLVGQGRVTDLLLTALLARGHVLLEDVPGMGKTVLAVCPQGIPLHLFNRKFIKDINEFYGEYQAGADLEPRTPLTNYEFEDVEPGIVAERG